MDLSANFLTDQKLSVLTGCEREFTGPFGLSLMWDQLLLEKPSLHQDKALISTFPSGEIKCRVTFQQLDSNAAYLAKHLRENFQPPEGDWIIAVCMTPSTDLIICLLAIFKAGAAYLPLDPLFPNDRIAHILKDANPTLLLTSTEILNDKKFDLIQDDVGILCMDTFSEVYKCSNQPTVNGLQQLSPAMQQDDLAIVLYTSGSTGTPKGVRLTYKTVHNRLNWQWNTFPYTNGEFAIFKTTITFIDSFIEIWAPLLKGVPIVIVPRIITQNPKLFVDSLDGFKVTRLFFVPSLLSSMLRCIDTAERGKLVNLRHWFCTGEVLSVKLLHEFYEKLDGVVCNLYGTTEISDVTCQIFRGKEDVNSSIFGGQVPLGLPLDNCAVYILNSVGKPVEPGQIGEIFASGAHVTSERYMTNKDLNNVGGYSSNNTDINKKGHQILYRTGDFGRIFNGKLFYEGRTDTQIKVRGHRVDISEVNAVLNKLDQVEIGVVLCWRSGLPEQEIVAFVKSTNPSSLHRILRDKIVSYAMPRIVFVEEIPLLVNGKIDRQRLLKEYENKYRGDHTTFTWNEDELNFLEAQEHSFATALFKTVSTVLGDSLQKSISLKDNYFFVGGNSLNAVYVVTKLRDQGFCLELNEFLSAKCLQDVVFKMENIMLNKIQQEGKLDQNQLKKYRTEPLNASHKEAAIRILCKGYAEKGDLEILAGIAYEDHEPLFAASWETRLSENLSFIVRDDQDRIVACSINHDALIKSVLLQPTTLGVKYDFEIMEHVWKLARQQKNSSLGDYEDWNQGQVLQCRKIATDSELLSPAENVMVVEYIERENMLVAKRYGFQGITTLNSSPLTQQICNDILGYEIVTEYQANQFVASDGTKPFAHALDSYLVTIGFKKL